jgi:4-amino-4-deoxy-L-arabinose transferase-like glycosyltransferase
MGLPSPASTGTPDRAPGWLVTLLGLFGLCWLAFFHGLGRLGLTDKTEALFVEVAHQMLQRGDWVTPFWNGQPFFDYPVGGYWLVALSLRCFGLSSWAARLPVASAASAVVVATFALVWWLGAGASPPRRRWLRAALAAAVLATTPAWLGWGRTSTTDMMLASTITLSLYSFLLLHHAPPGGRLAVLGRLGMAFFAGCAVLAKGPVGLLLPALVVGGFQGLAGGWWKRLRRLARRPGPPLAMTALFLGVVLPWYSAAALANGQAFVGGFLGFSNLQRFTSVLYAHPGPPWFYLPWLLVLLFPWSVYLPQALAALRLRPSPEVAGAALASPAPTAPGEAANPAGVPLFLGVWLVLVVAFFSAAATKLPGYILPCLPAASGLVALWLLPLEAGTAQAAPRWPIRLAAGSQAGLLAVMAGAAALAPRWAATDPAHPAFASALQNSGLPLLLALVLALTALGVGLSLWRWAGAGERFALALPPLAGFLAILALVVSPLAGLIDRERQLPLRQLAQEARRQARPGEPLWIVGTKRYSMVFYAGESAAFLGGRSAIRKQRQDDPASLGLLPSTRTVRLFGDRSSLEELRLPSGPITRLARRGQQELWRVPLSALPGR